MSFAAGFAQPNEAALALLAGKPAFTRAVFKGLLPELKARAITVSGVTSLHTIQRVQDEIAGLPAGAAWADAKAGIVDVLAEELGDGAEGRAELLLRTHGFQAYNAGVYDSGMADEDTTHWQYLTMEDGQVRDSHAALNGIVLPKDDPFWDEHFPPWDWGCRCQCRPMNPDLVAMEKAADEGRPETAKNVVEGAVKDRLTGKLPPDAAAEGPDGLPVKPDQAGAGSYITRSIPVDPMQPFGKQKEAKSFDVSPPSGAGAFSGSPGKLFIPLADLKARYDPAEWGVFEAWAKRTEIGPGKTVWDWLRK